MLSKKLCVFGVAMLICGVLAADDDEYFAQSNYDIDVGGSPLQGAQQTRCYGLNGVKYVIQIVKYNGALAQIEQGDWDNDPQYGFTMGSSGSLQFMFSIMVTTEIQDLQFYMFLYFDENGDGDWDTGEPIRDTATIDTY